MPRALVVSSSVAVAIVAGVGLFHWKGPELARSAEVAKSPKHGSWRLADEPLTQPETKPTDSMVQASARRPVVPVATFAEGGKPTSHAIDDKEARRLRELVRDVEDSLLDGSIRPMQVIGAMTELLELHKGEVPFHDPGGGWKRYELANSATLGSVVLRVGPPEVVRHVILSVDSETADYLDEPAGVVGSQLKVHVGLGAETIEYCATSLQARILPSSDVVRRYEAEGPVRTGATYEIRDGYETWSEIVLEVAGQTTTTALKPPREKKKLSLESFPRAPLLRSALQTLAGE